MLAGLLEELRLVRRGAAQGTGEHLEGAGGVEVQVDEIRRLNVALAA